MRYTLELDTNDNLNLGYCIYDYYYREKEKYDRLKKYEDDPDFPTDPRLLIDQFNTVQYWYNLYQRVISLSPIIL